MPRTTRQKKPRSPGPITNTGRNFDVAAKGNAWLAVQVLDGTEAYTRGGSLEVSSDGTLATRSGLPVVGDGGPLQVSSNAVISIGADGTVSTKATDGKNTAIGKLKLVTPKAALTPPLSLTFLKSAAHHHRAAVQSNEVYPTPQASVRRVNFRGASDKRFPLWKAFHNRQLLPFARGGFLAPDLRTEESRYAAARCSWMCCTAQAYGRSQRSSSSISTAGTGRLNRKPCIT